MFLLAYFCDSSITIVTGQLTQYLLSAKHSLIHTFIQKTHTDIHLVHNTLLTSVRDAIKNKLFCVSGEFIVSEREKTLQQMNNTELSEALDQ